MLDSADACETGSATVWGDVVESTNYISKKGCNGHSSRVAGWGGKSAVELEAVVVGMVFSNFLRTVGAL